MFLPEKDQNSDGNRQILFNFDHFYPFKSEFCALKYLIKVFSRLFVVFGFGFLGQFFQNFAALSSLLNSTQLEKDEFLLRFLRLCL